MVAVVVVGNRFRCAGDGVETSGAPIRQGVHHEARQVNAFMTPAGLSVYISTDVVVSVAASLAKQSRKWMWSLRDPSPWIMLWASAGYLVKGNTNCSATLVMAFALLTLLLLFVRLCICVKSAVGRIVEVFGPESSGKTTGNKICHTAESLVFPRCSFSLCALCL